MISARCSWCFGPVRPGFAKNKRYCDVRCRQAMYDYRKGRTPGRAPGRGRPRRRGLTWS